MFVSSLERLVEETTNIGTSSSTAAMETLDPIPNTPLQIHRYKMSTNSQAMATSVSLSLPKVWHYLVDPHSHYLLYLVILHLENV